MNTNQPHGYADAQPPRSHTHPGPAPMPSSADVVRQQMPAPTGRPYSDEQLQRMTQNSPINPVGVGVPSSGHLQVPPPQAGPAYGGRGHAGSAYGAPAYGQRPHGPSAPGQAPSFVAPPAHLAPQQPYPTQQPNPHRGIAEPKRRAPRFSREQIVAGLLAGSGVAVTLIGIILLLVMAAREGILTPGVRVAGGAALAGALAVAAAWVRPRSGGRIGSVALLATGAAAGFFDVIAVTRIYDWVPLTAGLLGALLVAAAVGLQAMRWDERWLFAAVTVAVAALAPALTGGVTGALVAFLVVVQIAGLAPEFTKGWDELSAARTVPAALAALCFVGANADASVPVSLPIAAATVVIALVGLASAVLVATRRTVVRVAPIALVVSWLPVWALAVNADRLSWGILSAAMTLIAVAGLYLLRGAHDFLRIAALALVGVSALVFGVGTATGTWMAVPFLALSLGLFAAAPRVRLPLTAGKAPAAHLAAMIALAVGVVVQGFASPYLDLFYRSRAAELPNSVAVAGLMLVAVAVAATLAVPAVRHELTLTQTTLGFAGTAAVLGTSMTLIALVGGSRTSFFAVHLVVTVMALAAAAVVMNAGLRRPRHLAASMFWGLALVACALVKLFAFDLHYMGSMTKALTFVIAGLVLLAAGTKYARTYGEAAKARDERDEHAPISYGPHPLGL